MQKIVGVRFKDAGKIYHFNPKDMELKRDDYVMVETARGLEMGQVLVPPKELPDEEIVAPLKDVLRKASERDLAVAKENARLEGEAYTICQKKILDRGLGMKLVNVEYAFDRGKIMFYFTADGRVDFRELVKDLAAQFKTRIELRQIGVRDEAKMLGGLGCCGRPVCCKTFLGEFQPVSIKMAKEQNLSLSPTKISGLCGRLMCCLKYEQDTYECMRKQMPRVGKETMTPDGMGIVVENNIISEKSRIRLSLEDGTSEMREYRFHELTKPSQEDFYKHQARQEEAAALKAERDAAREERAARVAAKVAARRPAAAKPQKQPTLEAFEQAEQAEQAERARTHPPKPYSERPQSQGYKPYPRPHPHPAPHAAHDPAPHPAPNHAPHHAPQDHRRHNQNQNRRRKRPRPYDAPMMDDE